MTIDITIDLVSFAWNIADYDRRRQVEKFGGAKYEPLPPESHGPESNTLLSVVMSQILIGVTNGLMNPDMQSTFTVKAEPGVVRQHLYASQTMREWGIAGVSMVHDDHYTTVAIPNSHVVVYIGGGPYAGRVLYVEKDLIQPMPPNAYSKMLQLGQPTGTHVLVYEGMEYALGSLDNFGAFPVPGVLGKKSRFAN